MPASTLRLIAGLGNPGAGYVSTRHNAGFWFADRVAEAFAGSFRVQSRFNGELAEVQVGSDKLILLKPTTFMNKSGTARLKRGGGHGGHNGLRDIHRHLGADYLRLRVGIGHPGTKDLVHDYVLGRPGKADEQAIRDSLEDALRAVEAMLRHGWDHALKQLHTRAA